MAMSLLVCARDGKIWFCSVFDILIIEKKKSEFLTMSDTKQAVQTQK